MDETFTRGQVAVALGAVLAEVSIGTLFDIHNRAHIALAKETEDGEIERLIEIIGHVALEGGINRE